MNEEKILWTGRQNMKAALMSALINFFLLVAAVWLLANKNNLAKTYVFSDYKLEALYHKLSRIPPPL